MFNNIIYSNQSGLQQDNNEILLINGIKYQKFSQAIGQGSEGLVYKGINIQTKEFVAIKETIQNNQRIINAMNKIKQQNCSHIIGIKGIQQSLNYNYIIIMEFAHGEFYQFMQKEEFKKMGYQQKNSLFIQMVQGVEQLHQLGLFHRDLKPENFVYIEDQNKNKTIKLIDFGLVKETSHSLRKTVKIGSPYYMAPEILGNQGFYNKSVDIWSLGAIWYEILFGKTFFQWQYKLFILLANQDIINQIQNCKQEQIDIQIQQNPQIQQKEKNFIKKMLCINPQSRVQLKEILTAYNQNGQQNIIQPYIQQNRQNFYPNYNVIQSNNLGYGFSGVQQQFQVQNQLINSQEIQQIEQEARNQMLQQQNNQMPQQMDLEQINEMKKELEKQIEQEFSRKYEQQQDEFRKALQNQIMIKENQINEEREKAQKYEKDIEQIKEMKIQQEIQYQNEKNRFIKQKEEEFQYQIERLKQITQKEKEQKIEQKLKELEENLKSQIENKYLLEYNQKIIEMEYKQQLLYQQQLELKRLALFNILQSQKETINTSINQLNEQLKYLGDLNMKHSSQLISQIQAEILNHKQKVILIEETQQEIEQIQKLEILQEYEIKQVSEYNQSIFQQFDTLNKFTEQINALENQLRSQQQIEQQKEEKNQQLKKLKESFSKQFQNLQQESSAYSLDIKKIKEKISFYQEIQYEIQGNRKIQDTFLLEQKLTQDLQILKQKENNIFQLEQYNQIIQYQYFICKLEELQFATTQLKSSTKETNQIIQQIDLKFNEKHQGLIEELKEQLQENYDIFKCLSQNNKKYEQQIEQILNKIEVNFNRIKDLNQLFTLGIFQNYQQFHQTYNQIQKQVKVFENQYKQLNEQICHDQQIEQINEKRIKILETIQKQLINYQEKLSNLKQQLNNLINNQDSINEQTKNQIKEKSEQIDQNIYELNKQFLIFYSFNQKNSYETINNQVNQLEQFQQKLQQQVFDETQQFMKLQLLIQPTFNQTNNNCERELLKLNTELQSQSMLFSKALSQIKIECESYEFLVYMKDQPDKLKKILDEQKVNLKKIVQLSQENYKLSQSLFQDLEQKKGQAKIQAQELIKKLQENIKKAKDELEALYNNVNKIYGKTKVVTLNNDLIKNYEYLKQQNEELSQEQISINDAICKQQLNPSQLNQLKEKIKCLISKLNALNKILPKNIEIEQFNNDFKNNLEIFQLLYALVNYIKQFHITKYYERIKEHKKKQREKQTIQNGYIQVFNKKQEENTIKEKEAQNLLKKYQNMLFNNNSKMMIKDMEQDQQQMDQNIQQLENNIKQAFNIKLKGCLKQQSTINEIITKEYYKTSKYAQMLEFFIINNQNKH
ncbi:unnamed protein product [Paramecium pentaurelia]|uniref:non-specific serine/threonine protein kinase n=1 Tax=Paramecium pentaurelia TaxID=43138 RepID=A0A8S1WMN3_9CILI|nr:unnamed protein product [Paramecium pentaurelia]